MIPDDLRYSAVENGLIREESAKANYDNLQEKDQGKDIEPLECMLDLLRLYDGLRIYRLKKK
ncbi:MAG: hypothetical protein IJ079_08035 [Lachnospiraceae bacterium]|nr:hypothetical protein [Lachnospiraceae bacterium]